MAHLMLENLFAAVSGGQTFAQSLEPIGKHHYTGVQLGALPRRDG
jgi:hypothetical protein